VLPCTRKMDNPVLYQHIAEFIEERTTAEVVQINPALGYIDVTDKIGREILEPLFRNGVIVVAIHGALDHLPSDQTRIWLDIVDTTLDLGQIDKNGG